MCKSLSKVCCLCYLLPVISQSPKAITRSFGLCFPSNDPLGEGHESYQAGMGCLVYFSTFRNWNQSFLLDSAACLSPRLPLLLCNQRCPSQSSPREAWEPMVDCPQDSHLHLILWLPLFATHSCSCWPMFCCYLHFIEVNKSKELDNKLEICA